jgi:hypothetical protein
VRAPERLNAPETETRVLAHEIELAFANANPGLRPEMMAVQCGRRIFQEVRICLDKDLRGFRACPEVDRDGCRAGVISVPACAEYSELPARLPRGQLRGRDEARALRAHPRLSAAQGRAVARHRHPCGHRALRPFRRRSRAHGEWRDGIGRLDEPLEPEAEALLAPYRAVVAAVRDRHGAETYPGSPAILREMLRRQDRGMLIELHPADNATLTERFNEVPNLKVLHFDGWTLCQR